MFGYRRHAFKKAVSLLSAIRLNPDNLEALKSLQKLLVFEITLAEQRIRKCRDEARVSNARRPEYYRNRIRSLQKTIYYWKTFGDAIAFLYIDRFALKHVFYNTHNGNPKQSSGFISGSAGFSREAETFDNLINSGVPCVLADLTNTIRYGDICLLGDSDPVLLEVKSSKTQDRRRSRQRDRLRRLGEFYHTDKLAGFRGFPIVYRVASHTKYDAYGAEFNQCIRRAYDNGYAIVTPEEGVHYIAITQTEIPISNILHQVEPEEPWIIYLNSVKSGGTWAPYFPFTLLIESEHALYDFLLGRLHLTVVIDVAIVEKRIAEMGYRPVVNMEDDYPLRMQKAGVDDEVRIAKHLLLRAALETISVTWILRSAVVASERL